MLNIILIAVLLLFSAFFSSCETAFSSVNKIRLKNYASEGNKRAEQALDIANKFDNALTAILIGNNIVNIASTSISTVLFTKLFGNKGVGIATAVMTVLVLIFGEILPKSYAKENAEKLALLFTPFLKILIVILKPIIIVFSGLKKIVEKLAGNSEKKPSVTEAELKYIIDEIEEEGVLEEQESDLVRSALEFDEIQVSEILIPRVKVVAVEINTPVDEIREIFLTEFYSRIPVYEKNIDNIIGIITYKDFFKKVVGQKSDISGIIQEVLHISDLKLISEALKEMQSRKTHMAIVMDQYGGTKGIITMEDIIEELVGEIYDENDEVITTFQKISDNVYEVSGGLSINDMIEKLDINNEIVTSANTAGGWVMELMGRIPVENETIQTDIFKITVISADEQTVNKIRIELTIPEEDDEAEE
ncbi:MAG: hemolysin family protein [Oscillospiraceae bacterium]